MTGPYTSAMYGMTPAQVAAYLTLLTAPEDQWSARPCRDAEKWDLPTLSGSATTQDREAYAAGVEKRRNLYASCPLLDLCTDYARTRPQVDGVLAGTTEEQRARRRRRTA